MRACVYCVDVGRAALRCVTISAYTDLLCSTPTYDSRVWVEVREEKRRLCVSLSFLLHLSRACLGKIIAFYRQNLPLKPRCNFPRKGDAQGRRLL